MNILSIEVEGGDAGDGSLENIEWVEWERGVGWRGDLMEEEGCGSITRVDLHIEPSMGKSSCTKREQRAHVQ
jgi:hypothetical protein